MPVMASLYYLFTTKKACLWCCDR